MKSLEVFFSTLGYSLLNFIKIFSWTGEVNPSQIYCISCRTFFTLTSFSKSMRFFWFATRTIGLIVHHTIRKTVGIIDTAVCCIDSKVLPLSYWHYLFSSFSISSSLWRIVRFVYRIAFHRFSATNFASQDLDPCMYL